MSDLVLVAHGSPDPRHAEDVAALTARIRSLHPLGRVETSYLECHGPDATDAGTALRGHNGTADGPIVLVPMLLARAYHVGEDIPEAAEAVAAASGRRVLVTGALGPHPLVADAMSELVAGGDTDGVLIQIAGSSRRSAVDELVDGLRAALPAGPAYGFTTLDEYLPLDAARAALGPARRPVSAPCMIARGVLRDRMVARAAESGIPSVPGVLAGTDALARLVLARVAEASAA